VLSKKYVDEFLEQDRLAPSWVAGLLQNETQAFGAFWTRGVIVDLGSQLSRTEAELLLQLAKFCDVTVLVPKVEWAEEFAYLLEGYRLLEAQPHEKVKVAAVGADHGLLGGIGQEKNSTVAAFAFSGLLAEAKAAVSQVRRWLENGISPRQVAVIAPDIEIYWPMLAPLFSEEGIPVAKDGTFRLQTLPQVSQWLSLLRLSGRQVSFADLENALYLKEPFLRYEEFYSLFSELLGEEDLVRHDKIKKSFESGLLPAEILGRDEFLGFALRAWSKADDLTALEICLREFLSNADDRLTMSLSSWIYFLEQVIAKKEIRHKEADLDGVQVTNLSSADSVLISHRLFLGLCESQLKEKKNILLDPSDVGSISTELGFFIEHPEISSREFDLRWLSEHRTQESYYFYPRTGISGNAEAASSFWMSLPQDKELSPSELRWDQRQQAPLSWLAQDSELPEKLWLESQTRVEEDLGLEELPAVRLPRLPSLSPTSLERYRKCPFIFAAEKLFRLLDLPLVDLDLDRRSRGSLAHGLLEKISEEPRRFDWKDEEIISILSELRETLKLKINDEFSWRSLREKHLKLARRFLEFEKEWRRHFPKTKTAAREKSFQFHMDLATGKWNRDAMAGEGSQILMKGKIDRVDTDGEGQAVIIDYKLSAGSYKSMSNWLQENQLQLALYTLALEQGLVADFEDVQVVSAIYMVLKNMTRDLGFKVTESAGSLFDLDRKKNQVSAEEKNKLLEEIGTLIFEITQKIAAGKIQPEPMDKKDCADCAWRQQCRAPHLNL
jgi:RecB family exonuclease